MTIVPTRPFDGQKPGTSGLRKTVKVFAQPHYVENYVQAVIDCLPPASRNIAVVGGDGRYFSDIAIEKVLRILAANGFEQAIVGQHGWFSTPAVSHVVRSTGARVAFVLTASHNPGGPSGDFGIKLNLSNGGPASDALVEAIYQRTQQIDRYCMADQPMPDLSRAGEAAIGKMAVKIVDPVSDYRALMERLFDFDRLSRLARSGFTFLYDGLNGVTGPYAQSLFCNALGFPESCLRRVVPLPDFGGQHPDPNPAYAGRFFNAMMAANAPDCGAACDSDGDRHMIMGPATYVTPSDSLALLTEHMHLARGYRAGVQGVARSVGTSTAVDRVARRLGIACYETPTGWKYFGNLLEAGRISLCGEESAGASSTHIREKDGLWAVLLWLSIIANTEKGVGQLLQEHWARYGRTYYERRDYEEIDSSACHDLVSRLRRRISGLRGRPSVLGEVTMADDFSYLDPVDNTVAESQGIRLGFASGARVVVRLSGTGTVGSTLRLYGERYDRSCFDRQPNEYLESLFDILDQIAGISSLTRQYAPTLVT